MNEWQIMASRVNSASTALVHSKVDLTVWIEVCELAPDGQYLPVVVDQHDDTPCRGTLLFHQGIQRRIRVTIMHHPDYDVAFKDLRELVMGRVRTIADCADFDDENDASVLSLNLFFSEQLDPLEDGRSVFRFEAAWDTSLHNSFLLNRVTPSGERVFLTMSAYLDLERCSQPAILTKDLCVIIYGRDSRTLPLLSHGGLSTRVLKHLLTGSYKSAESNHVTSIFELVLRRSLEASSPGVQRRQRRVLDTSTMYVRGQENLGGWQPRGDSLIFDHQWELEKLTRLELVERTKHLLLLRTSKKRVSSTGSEDTFTELPSTNYSITSGMRTSASRLSLAALANLPLTGGSATTNALISPVSGGSGGPSLKSSLPRSSTFSSGIESLERETVEKFASDHHRTLCGKCVHLIQYHIATQTPPSFPSSSSNLLKTPTTTEHSSWHIGSDSSTPDLERINFLSGMGSWFEKEKAAFPQSTDGEGTLFVPEIEEVRMSSVISKKGYVSCLMASEFVSADSTKWSKQWIVVRRPYLLVYRDEKDPVERSVINLANARVECSEQQRQMLCVENAFSVVTKHAGYLFKTNSVREMYDWLYSINPLYAGQLMCEWARAHHEAAALASANQSANGSPNQSSSSSPNDSQKNSLKEGVDLYKQIRSDNSANCGILQ